MREFSAGEGAKTLRDPGALAGVLPSGELAEALKSGAMPVPNSSQPSKTASEAPRLDAAFSVEPQHHAFPARSASWYVVQVMAGREDHARELIVQAVELEEKAVCERAEAAGKLPCGLPVAEEIFVPKARVGVKRDGKWLPGEETLLPGYLVAIARDPDALVRALRRVRGFTRMVRQGNVAVPCRSETSGGSRRRPSAAKARWRCPRAMSRTANST